MRSRFARIATLAAAVALCITPALAQDHKDDKGRKDKGHGHAAAPAKVEVKKAVAVLSPTEGNSARGTVTFTKQDDGVLVEARVEGLEPNGKHGFHIHEFGDVSSADGSAAGGHFNPTGAPHGGPDSEERHAGDFGNLEANEQGVATYSRVDKHVKLRQALGHAVIVHASPDDLESQPTGNAGARIAQGVIGVAKAE